MEENKIEEKLSYEQLEKAALILQQRCNNAEAKLTAIEVTAVRLNYLFKVTEKAEMFPKWFVEKTINEIVELLDIKEQETKE